MDITIRIITAIKELASLNRRLEATTTPKTYREISVLLMNKEREYCDLLMIQRRGAG